MPTTFYYEDTTSALSIAGAVVRSLSLTRGSGLVSKTVASNTITPVSVVDSGSTQLGFAIRVNAYSATAGSASWNHWGLESNAMANFSAAMTGLVSTMGGITVYDNTGAFRFTLWTGGASAVEYGTAAAVRTNSGTASAQTVDAGDWIVAWPSHEGAGGSAASGFTLTFGYNGTTASANGDSFITLPDTITAYTAAAADQPYVNVYPSILAQ